MQSILFALLNLKLRFKELKDEERGATMVEYALLAALIAVFLITSITLMRDAIATLFGNIAAAL